MGKGKKFVALTAADCIEALRGRYRAPAYALLEQVANGTGWKADRFADAVVMSLWPSRGLTVTGFEVKVSRHDYQREIHKPKKSDELMGFCNAWYIVTPRGLLDEADLVDFPKAWGLMEVTAAKKLKIERAAPELDPKPLTRHFVAAVLRRSAESADAVLARERDRARQQGAEEGHGQLANQLRDAREQTARLRQVIADFEKASGVKIDHYYPSATEIGRAVRVVLDAGARQDFLEELASRLDHFESMAKRTRDDLHKMASLRDGGTNGKGKNEDANEEADEEADEEDEGEAHDGRHAQGEGEAHHQATEERP